jgi:hypothetical protein
LYSAVKLQRFFKFEDQVMEMATNPLSQLNRWCLEAASEFGDDWGSIQLYVREKLALLTEKERAQFLREVSSTLARPESEHIN